MNKQEIEFYVRSKNGVATEIGKSCINQPKIKYNGKKMPWFDDSKLLKKKKTDNNK